MFRKALIVLTVAFILLIIYSMVPMRKKQERRSGAMKERWVILVHGVMRSPASMGKIESALREKGFSTVNFGYSSRREPVKTVTKRLHREILKISERDIESISFVTHSFGTIVVRYYLAHHTVKKLGRFVMIAPPNKGSEWARILGRLSLYHWAMGIAGLKVQDVEKSIPKIMAPPPCDFGVIAGGTGTRIGINPMLRGDDDGTVTVDETKLEGMKDFVQVRGQHSMLLVQKKVSDNVISFLEEGTFLH